MTSASYNETTLAFGRRLADRADAALAEWMAATGADIEPVIQVGDETGRSISRVKSEGMARLNRDALTDTARHIGLSAVGYEDSFEFSKEPTAYIASPSDPELLGLYAATPKESEMAKRARGTVHGLDSFGRVKGGKTGQVRMSKAEKAAAIRARRAK